MKRLLTAAIGTPVILAAVFLLDNWWFFAVMALIMEGAVWEYAQIGRSHAPRAPLRILLLLVPAVALGLSFVLLDGAGGPDAHRLLLLGGALLLSVGIGTILLFSRTPLEEIPAALGVLAFGVLYFALPATSLQLLQRIDPWVIFLLLAIVWLGDTAAFYVGSRIGRHKMAPVISPKKSWEGAAASFGVAIAAAAVWSVCRRGGLDWGLLGAAAVTAVAAQIGDLVESMIKRSSGVKDSGNILPGHGGMLDRMDAMLFAAPVLLFTLWIFGVDATPR
jgi:phosphatidate cytidylyltransferase